MSTFAPANPRMVRWMNGLVSGLQNQPRRFDSATHLKQKANIIMMLAFFICYMYVVKALRLICQQAD